MPALKYKDPADGQWKYLPSGQQGPVGPAGPQGIQGIQGPAGTLPDSAPRGLILRTPPAVADGTIVSTAPVVIARFRNIPLVAGRAYRAMWFIRSCRATGATPGNLGMAVAEFNPAGIGLPYMNYDLIAPVGSNNTFTSGTYTVPIFPTTTTTYTLAINATSYGYVIPIDVRFGASGNPAIFTVEDIGLAVAETSPT